MTPSSAKLAFIGGGNMATSIIGGLIDSGYEKTRIYVSAPSEKTVNTLSQQFGIQTSVNNTAIITGADVIILAVKPQMLAKVCKEIKKELQNQNTLIISVAAGATIEFMQNLLGDNTPIVRCMPNTPALIGRGATGLFANPQVSAAQKTLTETILNSVGLSLWFTNEPQLDMVTALSGSGPAYFFLFMEALQNAAQTLGLTEDAARQLTLQTALGAAELAMSSNEPIATLRQRVTSPGGTTEQGLKTLTDGGLPALCEKTLIAAQQRAQALAQQLMKEESGQ